MKVTLQEGLNVVTSALTIFRERMIEEKVPGIVFPEFVSVNDEGGVGLLSKATVTESSSGGLDDGLIGEKTTSLDTVDIGYGLGESPIVAWAKSATYTLRELEVCKRLGIDIDTRKMAKLRQNAEQTLQKVAFVGHAKDTRITGLLNNNSVKVATDLLSGNFSELKGQALCDAFVEMYKRVLDQTHLIEAPTFIIVPSLDYVSLATTNRDVGTDTTALTYLKESLKAAAGKDVNIKPVPLKYADTAGGTKKAPKKRILCYINEPTHVEFDIPVAPDVLDAQPVGLNAIQSGMRMDFGSVVFHEPNSALYIDY